MVYIYKFRKLCRLYDHQRLRAIFDSNVQPGGPAEGGAANLPVPEANWMIPYVSPPRQEEQVEELPGGNAAVDMTGSQSQLSADFISEILTYLASTPDLKCDFGNLKYPLLACKKLPKCLTLYAAAVSCHDSKRLFDKDQTIGKAMPVKGWHYVTTLASLEYFRDMTSRERWRFVKKMASSMRMSGLTSNRAATGMNNSKCMFGWTLGFWLARLYNVQGIDDAHLPVALQTAKQRFLENFGMHLGQWPVALPFRQTMMKQGGVTPTMFPGAECRPPKVRTGPPHNLPGPSAVTKDVSLNQANPDILQMYEADGSNGSGSDMAVQPTAEDEVMDTSESEPPVILEENKGVVSLWEDPVYLGYAGEVLEVGEAPRSAATWDNEKEI